MIGDAAGLVRPFKGKGVNSAVITGIRVAETIMNDGISTAAFAKYARRCRSLAGNRKAGRLAQILTQVMGATVGTSPLIRFARSSREFRTTLHGAIAGTADYGDTLRACLRPRILLGLGACFLEQAAGVRRSGTRG